MKLDPGQFGGLSKHSIVHYLILLINFILTNHDQKDKIPRAIILALCDYSKGFNRIDHSNVIIRLSDWGVPGWLLKILVSYLTERTMVLKYKGAVSDSQDLPGGSCQGSLLGCIIFLVELSDAGMPVPPQPSLTGVKDVVSLDSPLQFSTEDEIRLKYIDDQTQGEVVRLDTNLEMNIETAGPRLYHDRHGHRLPSNKSILQTRLNQIQEYADVHQLKLNKKKTKVMSFNTSRKYDFLPKLTIGGEQLEVVDQTKLLGVMISNDLRWNHHIEYIVKKARKRFWYLRRLSILGASTGTLMDIYHSTTRCLMEDTAPVFAGALTKTNCEDLEDVQKGAFKIILRGNYRDYGYALEMLDQETLEVRRKAISLKFAKKNHKHPKMKHLFPIRKNNSTRRGPKFVEKWFPTTQAQNGPINYLIRLLNESCEKKL